MQVYVVMFRQDDPKKCTAAKLVKFGLARQVGRTQGRTIVLDPFAKTYLLKKDAKAASSITGIDCSWNLAEGAFSKRFQGMLRKLPPLLAGNPVNYAKLGKLTTVEAIAGAAFILGHEGLAAELLSKFTTQVNYCGSMPSIAQRQGPIFRCSSFYLELPTDLFGMNDFIASVPHCWRVLTGPRVDNYCAWNL